MEIILGVSLLLLMIVLFCLLIFSWLLITKNIRKNTEYEIELSLKRNNIISYKWKDKHIYEQLIQEIKKVVNDNRNKKQVKWKKSYKFHNPKIYKDIDKVVMKYLKMDNK